MVRHPLAKGSLFLATGMTMDSSVNIFGYWAFTIPNYILAALMWTLIGRFLLGLFVPPDWDNYIWKGFRRLTDAPLRLVRAITPQIMPALFLAPIGAFWVAIARALWFLIAVQIGLISLQQPAG